MKKISGPRKCSLFCRKNKHRHSLTKPPLGSEFSPFQIFSRIFPPLSLNVSKFLASVLPSLPHILTLAQKKIVLTRNAASCSPSKNRENQSLSNKHVEILFAVLSSYCCMNSLHLPWILAFSSLFQVSVALFRGKLMKIAWAFGG